MKAQQTQRLQDRRSARRIPGRRSLVLLFLAAGAAAAQAPQPDALEIIRRSVEQDRANFERARDYTFIERAETRELDSKGKAKKVGSETFDVLILGGRPYKKLIAKDDQPLSAKEAAKAEADFEKELKKRQGENEKERRRLAEQEERRRRQSRAFLKEIPQAFDFRLVGEEQVDGQTVWVISAEPRPDFRPKAKRADLLAKFRGRIWIDQKELQWVRVEAETVDTVSFGLFLARLGKGAKLTFEQRRVNGEVWLPSRASTKLDARLALVRKLNVEMDVAWRDYRKFRTDSRVVDASELASEP